MWETAGVAEWRKNENEDVSRSQKGMEGRMRGAEREVKEGEWRGPAGPSRLHDRRAGASIKRRTKSGLVGGQGNL